MTFKPCAIIPTHNHHVAVEATIRRIGQHDVPTFIIDDGSTDPAKSALAVLHDPDAGVRVHRLMENQGKGAAVMVGFRLASDNDFSHAIQIDADGQHDLEHLGALLALAEANPTAVICGHPHFDDSMPLSRKLSRWFSNYWVHLETLSFQITDGMCGYRAYPLAPCLHLIDQGFAGRRMDFDSEIIVRLSWCGTPIIMTPVKIRYPKGNLSNFRLLQDNWLITKMHTRLMFTMLSQFPTILRNRHRRSSSKHWASLSEIGAGWGLYVLAVIYRLSGTRLLTFALLPVVAYSYLVHRERRHASRDFLQRLASHSGVCRTVPRFSVFRHFMSFSNMAADKLAAWNGGIGVENLIIPAECELDETAEAGHGALVIVSHLGNVEVSRALSKYRHNIRVTALSHTKNAVKFNRLLAAHNKSVAIDVVQVSDLGMEIAADLKDRVDDGGWIVVAGDRTPVTDSGRVAIVDFLGAPATFPLGPYILARLLKCPVYYMFCMKEADGFRIIFHKLADSVAFSHGNRNTVLERHLRDYVCVLEKTCARYPLQWYNFFDFWRAGS